MLKYHIDQCNIFGVVILLITYSKISQKYNYTISKNNKSRVFGFIEFFSFQKTYLNR